MKQQRTDDQPRIASPKRVQPFLQQRNAQRASSQHPCSSSLPRGRLGQPSVGVFGPSSDRSVPHTDGGFGESVGSDQLVVGRMEGDNDHTDLAGNTLRGP
jgi:hypothetical protein